MKLTEIINARDALQKLVAQDLPIRTAYEVMKLTEECNRHLGFYGQELSKFDPAADPGRLDELNNMEISTGSGQKITIALDSAIRLSASDIKMLLPLVDFQE